MKQRIPWSKAPKIKNALLVGHAFGKDGDGYFEYLEAFESIWISAAERSGITKPRGLDWRKSFVRAPQRVRK